MKHSIPIKGTSKNAFIQKYLMTHRDTSSQKSRFTVSKRRFLFFVSLGPKPFLTYKSIFRGTLKVFTWVLCLWMSQGWARALDDGNEAFAAGQYEQALEAYYQARSDMPDSRLLNFNIGTALYKLNRYEEAKQELMQAVYSLDTTVARQAAYNLANTQYRYGQSKEQPAEKIAAWREAIALYKKAIDLDPDYEKAKRNVEVVQRKLKEELDRQKNQQDQNQDNQNDQKQPPLSEEAKQAKARALALVQQGQFETAYKILDDILSRDETAKSLKSIAQRVQDIIDISAGREPTRPTDQSNMNQELEVI